jgi:hypothetical protein
MRKMKTQLLFTGCMAMMLACIACSEKAEVSTPSPTSPSKLPAGRESFEVRYEESRFLRRPDGFLPANDPPTVSADQATFLQEEDEVLGFVIDGHARAYDVRALSYHHIVNDRIGQTPIAVTY